MSASGKAGPWEDLALGVERPESRRGGDIPAAYLTHELRAPVTAIRLGLEMLQEQTEGKLGAEERQLLGFAVRNTARLEGLVDDVMDYSKIMAGRFRLERRPCRAGQLLAEAADSMRSLALAQGVRLAVEPGEPLPRISAEGRRIVQVLTNLISNAVKFTPARGRVTISAELGRRDHAGTILFKVKDNGRGIPAEDVEAIFDMFIQSPRGRNSGGTGLGLTLSRLMVEAHGGRIWADSWRGVGSTFCFTIPIAAQDLGRRPAPYPKPLEYSGLLVGLARGFNSFLALFL